MGSSSFYGPFFTSSSGELHFAPGDRELEIAVNVVDDDVPEEQEYFHVTLKHPKGGAEIGFGGQMTIVVPANDDAHGVVGFAEVSRWFGLGRDGGQTDSSSLVCGVTPYRALLTGVSPPLCRTFCLWKWKSWSKTIQFLSVLRGKEGPSADLLFTGQPMAV